MFDDLRDEHRAFVEVTRSFVARELARGASPRGDALGKALGIGLFHVLLTEATEGAGREVTPLCAALAEISKTDAGFAAVVLANAFAQEVFFAAGEHARLAEIVARATDVRSTLLAYPLFYDPGAVDLAVTAKSAGGAYAVSGPLEYVACGTLADGIVVPAKVEGRNGYTFFYVGRSEEGIDRSAPVASLGLCGCPSVDIVFDRAPATLLGRVGDGRDYYRAARDRMQVAAAAIAAGILAGSFGEALRYARERVQGGRAIIDWSEVRMMLADMAANARVAQMILARACRAVDASLPEWRECALAAAVHAHELAVKSTTDGIQVLGGAGYMEDFGQEARFRDAQQIQSVLGAAPFKMLGLIDEMAR